MSVGDVKIKKMRLSILNTLFLVLFGSAVFCQVELDTIPFTLNESNNIIIEAVVNESDTLAFMFHTGVNSMSLTPEVSERISRNKLVKETEIGTWTETKESGYITNNSVQIGKQKTDSLTIWLDLLSGYESQGKFGPNFFGDKLIEINYDDSILVIHDSSATVGSLEIYKSTSLQITDHHSILLNATLNFGTKTVDHTLMLHTGYGGSIILDDAFKNANPELKQLEELSRKELKDSFGNSMFIKKVMPKSISFLGETLEGLSIAYFDSDLEMQKTSIVGCEMMKRFNFILDIENAILYTKPNRNFSLPFIE